MRDRQQAVGSQLKPKNKFRNKLGSKLGTKGSLKSLNVSRISLIHTSFP